MTSDKLWTRWKSQPRNILIPDELDSAKRFNFFYGMPVHRHAGVFWGALWTFRMNDLIVPDHAFRRDGVRFERLPTRPAMIPLGKDGSWDDAMIFPDARWVEVGDEWWIYSASVLAWACRASAWSESRRPGPSGYRKRIPLNVGRPATASTPAQSCPALPVRLATPSESRGPEGHGIARWLNKHGITGIVLEYELPRGRPEVPLRDAQRAIRTARANAKAWKLDPRRIGIMGFSAGGHLASTAGTHFDAGNPKAADPVDRVSCRPDFMVLIYPVITMGAKTHRGSKRNLLGRNPGPETVKRFSNQMQVTKNTPPAFLAHARDDKAVVPENSLMFHNALKAKQVATKYVELPRGGHGLNGYRGPMWDAWQAASLRWLVKQRMIPAASAKVRK